MTSAVLGSGATLGLGSGASPQVYTTIAEVVRCGPIGSSNAEVDVTNLDSTAKEYIAGLDDGNTVEFEVNWIAGNTEQVSLRTSQIAGSTVNLRMVWQTSPNTIAKFDFVLLSFQISDTTAEQQVTASISGRITGSISWT
ncbi:MAG: phage tail tube protein [Acidiferrobacterales bacterium]